MPDRHFWEAAAVMNGSGRSHATGDFLGAFSRTRGASNEEWKEAGKEQGKQSAADRMVKGHFLGRGNIDREHLTSMLLWA